LQLAAVVRILLSASILFKDE